MKEFNLIDEPWISVITDTNGETKLISLKELFKNASKYKDFGGDMKTQDFAVMRVILSIIHTVFSRVDENNQPYKYFELDDTYKQIKIKSNNLVAYKKDLMKTWEAIWQKQEFPTPLFNYLDKWYDRFYLLSDEYPFFQVTKNAIDVDKLSSKKATPIYGKNINRLISESENKTELFSPKMINKDILTKAELARWLIMYQGYTGLSDKVMFGTEKYKASKGWLFDIGGIYLKGDNLFETLMLNTLLPHMHSQKIQTQKPCWEYNSEDIINQYFESDTVTDISRLYTAWSRAIYINPTIDLNNQFMCEIVKLPNLNHQNTYIEPMTLWRYNTTGENNDTHTPKKHQFNVSMWRNFGLLTGSISEDEKQPEIIRWKNKLTKDYNITNINICAVSMQDNGNSTSWIPTNEILDDLVIDDYILANINNSNIDWVHIIHNTVEKTQKAINFYYKSYLNDIATIRNINKDDFINKQLESIYYHIDKPFRQWLSSLNTTSIPNDEINKWMNILSKIILNAADLFIKQNNPRDYKGTGLMNIFTAYNKLSKNIYFNNKLENENEQN